MALRIPKAQPQGFNSHISRAAKRERSSTRAYTVSRETISPRHHHDRNTITPHVW